MSQQEPLAPREHSMQEARTFCSRHSSCDLKAATSKQQQHALTEDDVAGARG